MEDWIPSSTASGCTAETVDMAVGTGIRHQYLEMVLMVKYAIPS